VLTALNTRVTADTVTMLEDHEQSFKEMCCTLVDHLLYAEMLLPDRLPLEVPIMLCGERMQTHPFAITGSFAHVKKVDNANAIEIPYGRDAGGMQITDPVVKQPPILPPIPAAPPPVPPTIPGGAPPVVAPVVGNAPDPNAALLQGVFSAIQAMMQMNIQSDLRNASMTQQQSSLQAALMQANQMQLQHLTNHLGNLGHEVGKAIASHPTRHNHTTIQATLSQPNVAPGQSNDPRVLGLLTQTTPPSMSVPSFNYSPCVQAFQPQRNDKHTRSWLHLTKKSRPTFWAQIGRDHDQKKSRPVFATSRRLSLFFFHHHFGCDHDQKKVNFSSSKHLAFCFSDQVISR